MATPARKNAGNGNRSIKPKAKDATARRKERGAEDLQHLRMLEISKPIIQDVLGRLKADDVGTPIALHAREALQLLLPTDGFVSLGHDDDRPIEPFRKFIEDCFLGSMRHQAKIEVEWDESVHTTSDLFDIYSVHARQGELWWCYARLDIFSQDDQLSSCSRLIAVLPSEISQSERDARIERALGPMSLYASDPRNVLPTRVELFDLPMPLARRALRRWVEELAERDLLPEEELRSDARLLDRWCDDVLKQ